MSYSWSNYYGWSDVINNSTTDASKPIKLVPTLKPVNVNRYVLNGIIVEHIQDSIKVSVEMLPTYYITKFKGVASKEEIFQKGYDHLKLLLEGYKQDAKDMGYEVKE